MKTWKKELVCDNCRRWASGLTLIKPGDKWDGTRAPAQLVGRKVCYRCVAREFGLGQPARLFFPDELPLVTIEAALALSTFAIFALAIIVRADPTVPALLFYGSVGLLLLEREIRRYLKKRENILPGRETQKEWADRKSMDPSLPLVSTETLFGKSLVEPA